MSKKPFLSVVLSTLLILIASAGCGSGGGGGGTGPPGGLPVKLEWSRPIVSGTPPELTQAEHAAAYDPSKSRVIMAWGVSASLLIDEIWEIRLLEDEKIGWAKLLPSSIKDLPDPRAGHSAVYDTLSQRAIFFGGYTQDGPSNEVWEMVFWEDQVNGSWQGSSPLGEAPAPRVGHAAVFDEADHQMIVFGGWDRSGTFFNDLWGLRLGADPSPVWEKLSGEIGPGARAEHSSVVDPAKLRMILFGGRNGVSRLNDVWELNWSTGLFNWKELDITGTPPSARSGHSAVYDAAKDRMIIFGGFDGKNRLNDIWVLDLSEPGSGRWEPVSPEGDLAPAVREQHIAIREANAGSFRMVVFGGNGDSDGEVWTLK